MQAEIYSASRIWRFSENMLNKPENGGAQALHTLLTYKY